MHATPPCGRARAGPREGRRWVCGLQAGAACRAAAGASWLASGGGASWLLEQLLRTVGTSWLPDQRRMGRTSWLRSARQRCRRSMPARSPRPARSGEAGRLLSAGPGAHAPAAVPTQRRRHHAAAAAAARQRRGAPALRPQLPLASMSVLPASSNSIIRYVLMDLEESTLLSVPTSSRPTCGQCGAAPSRGEDGEQPRPAVEAAGQQASGLGTRACRPAAAPHAACQAAASPWAKLPSGMRQRRRGAHVAGLLKQPPPLHHAAAAAAAGGRAVTATSARQTAGPHLHGRHAVLLQQPLAGGERH